MSAVVTAAIGKSQKKINKSKNSVLYTFKAFIIPMGAFAFEGGDAYDFADGEAVITASRKSRSKN